MQAILLIIFIGLQMFNTNICNHFYNYDLDFGKWYYLRCDIYEVMFLIAVIIPWFKTTLFSKSLMVFGGVLIGASVIDKVFLDVHTISDREWFIIVPFAMAAGYLLYEKRNK